MLSTLPKILLKVVYNRIFRKLDINISDTQFGLCKRLRNKGSTVQSQKCLDVNQFIETLVKRRIDLRDIRMISNQYYGQKAKIRIENIT